jgi:hypothetical protein
LVTLAWLSAGCQQFSDTADYFRLKPKPITLEFEQAEQSVMEAVGHASAWVKLNNRRTSETIVVTYHGSNDPVARTLTFAPGTDRQEIAWSWVDNAIAEPARDTVFTLANATGAAKGVELGQSRHTAHILDDDVASLTQTINVTAGSSVANVDLRIVIDDSASMSHQITSLKNTISGFLQLPSMQSANLRVGLNTFGNSYRAYEKYDWDQNFQTGTGYIWGLPSAGAGVRYNTLNISPTGGSYNPMFFYPGAYGKMYFDPVSEMSSLQSRLTQINYTTGNQTENGWCSALLGYQTIQTPALDAYTGAQALSPGYGARRDANLVTMIVTDEDSTNYPSSNCTTKMKEPTARNITPTSCYCYKPCTYETVCQHYDCNPMTETWEDCVQTPPNCTGQQCVPGTFPDSYNLNSCADSCNAGYSKQQTGGNVYYTFPGNTKYVNNGIANTTEFVSEYQAFRAAHTPNRSLSLAAVIYTGNNDGAGGTVCNPTGPNAFEQSVGTKYKELVNALNTANGAQSSSVQCITNDFSSIFNNIAQTITTTIFAYNLNQPASKAIQSVKRVRGGGAPVPIPESAPGTPGWYETASPRKINFDQGVIQVGDVVTVTYAN